MNKSVRTGQGAFHLFTAPARVPPRAGHWQEERLKLRSGEVVVLGHDRHRDPDMYPLAELQATTKHELERMCQQSGGTTEEAPRVVGVWGCNKWSQLGSNQGTRTQGRRRAAEYNEVASHEG